MWIELAINRVLTIIVEELATPCFRISHAFPAIISTHTMFLFGLFALIPGSKRRLPSYAKDSGVIGTIEAAH
jgi:hypothetical protein